MLLKYFIICLQSNVSVVNTFFYLLIGLCFRLLKYITLLLIMYRKVMMLHGYPNSDDQCTYLLGSGGYKNTWMKFNILQLVS